MELSSTETNRSDIARSAIKNLLVLGRIGGKVICGFGSRQRMCMTRFDSYRRNGENAIALFVFLEAKLGIELGSPRGGSS